MWIKASGALSESVVQVTTATSSHCLVVGGGVAIVDTGLDATADQLISEIERCLGEDGELDFVLLTHFHFDHIGGLPLLRKRWPAIEVFGAPHTAQLLSDPQVRAELYRRNAACAEAMKKQISLGEAEWVEQIKIDRIIGDGDVIDIGGDVEIKLLSCPGHTEDSVAYFIRPDSALLSGEAIGCYRGRDQVTACFTGDYQQYMESLDKLSGLDVRVLGFPHGGALTGELVPKYFVQAKAEAENFCRHIKERIEQGELVDEICSSMLPDWRAQNICPEGPFAPEQEQTLLAMVRAAAAA